jgi:hypothetical protein
VSCFLSSPGSHFLRNVGDGDLWTLGFRVEQVRYRPAMIFGECLKLAVRAGIAGSLIVLVGGISSAAAFNLAADAVLERAEIGRSVLQLFGLLPDAVMSEGPKRYSVRLGSCRFSALIRATPFTGKAPPGIPLFDVLIGPPQC